MKIQYKTLYIAWAVLYALTAALGLIQEPEGALSTFMTLLSMGFFLPPWVILSKAKGEDRPSHLRLIRYLGLAWVAVTVVLLCASILSVGRGEGVGNFLYYAMTIACAPMVCSQLYALPMALWGVTLALTREKR